ncbi:MAG TPA: hypothetical protein VIL45_07125 [Thermoplasmata archaeon]
MSIADRLAPIAVAGRTSYLMRTKAVLIQIASGAEDSPARRCFFGAAAAMEEALFVCSLDGDARWAHATSAAWCWYRSGHPGEALRFMDSISGEVPAHARAQFDEARRMIAGRGDPVSGEGAPPDYERHAFAIDVSDLCWKEPIGVEDLFARINDGFEKIEALGRPCRRPRFFISRDPERAVTTVILKVGVRRA